MFGCGRGNQTHHHQLMRLLCPSVHLTASLVARAGNDPASLAYQANVIPLYYPAIFGATREIRTPNPLITKQPLYRWSYGGIVSVFNVAREHSIRCL